jgi:SnoaL-like domain
VTQPAMPRGPQALDIAARWQQAPREPDTLAAIQNVMQAYALFTDHARGEDLAGLFTDDACWDGRDLGYGTATGPQEIARAVLAHVKPDSTMVHLPGPPILVTESEREVAAFSWCLATRSVGGQVRPLIFFCYEDLLRFDERGWLFAHRTLRRTLPAPPKNGAV